MPSAATTYWALIMSPLSSVTSAPSAVWLTPVATYGRWTLPPSSSRRSSRTCSVMFCGTISVYGYSVGSRSNRTGTSSRSPSRMLNCRAWIPSPASRFETPIRSSISSVRACTTAAREVFAPAACRSTTVTSWPCPANEAATANPTGPAPTTSTSVRPGSSLITISFTEQSTSLAAGPSHRWPSSSA